MLQEPTQDNLLKQEMGPSESMEKKRFSLNESTRH